MSCIPIYLTPEQFEHHVEPHLSKAQRGFVSTIPRYKIFNYILYVLHTGCQWERLPIDPDKDHPETKEISHWAIYHHFRKWSKDGSLEKVWNESLPAIQAPLDLSELNLDGSHTIAKKGGESVAYQGRKKAKTSNVLPITDKHGYLLSSTGMIAGNHNDAFNLKPHLQAAFKDLKQRGLDIEGA